MERPKNVITSHIKVKPTIKNLSIFMHDDSSYSKELKKKTELLNSSK